MSAKYLVSTKRANFGNSSSIRKSENAEFLYSKFLIASESLEILETTVKIFFCQFYKDLIIQKQAMARRLYKSNSMKTRG